MRKIPKNSWHQTSNRYEVDYSFFCSYFLGAGSLPGYSPRVQQIKHEVEAILCLCNHTDNREEIERRDRGERGRRDAENRRFFYELKRSSKKSSDNQVEEERSEILWMILIN